MVDYMAAIKRPFQDLTTLVIGIIIGLIPIVQLLVTGFGLKCAQASLNNNPALPKWQDNIVDTIVK